jgi:hypothetical protein
MQCSKLKVLETRDLEHQSTSFEVDEMIVLTMIKDRLQLCRKRLAGMI